MKSIIRYGVFVLLLFAEAGYGFTLIFGIVVSESIYTFSHQCLYGLTGDPTNFLLAHGLPIVVS